MPNLFFTTSPTEASIASVCMVKESMKQLEQLGFKCHKSRPGPLRLLQSHLKQICQLVAESDDASLTRNHINDDAGVQVQIRTHWHAVSKAFQVLLNMVGQC